MEGLPLCDNSILLRQYSEYYFWLMLLGRDELVENTKCQMPCSFLEYKAGTNYFFFVKCLCFFVLDN